MASHAVMFNNLRYEKSPTLKSDVIGRYVQTPGRKDSLDDPQD